MQVSRAKNAFAARAHTPTDDVKPLLADVALRAHISAREDTEESHLNHHGRFVLLLFGRTFATVQTTMVAQLPWPAGVNCGGVCEP